MDVKDFQERLGIRFRDTDLLAQALTHRSYVNEQGRTELQDNERLEYLGDAILDFITADMLYKRFPDMTEGEMTRLRAALVRTEALAQIAEDYALGQALLMGKGEANSGGRERANNLCGGFEAVIGAMYLDQGLEAVREFILPRLQELEKEVIEDAIRKDSRSQFQEWVQATHNITPEYRLISTTGPDHEKQFTVVVMIGDSRVAEGHGKSKRAAAQDAARIAMSLVEDGEFELTVPEPTPEPEDSVGDSARQAVIDFFERVNSGWLPRS